VSQLDEVEEILADAPIIQRTQRQIAWTRFKRNKVGVFSAGVAIFFVVAAFLAPVLTYLMGLKDQQTYSKALNQFGMPLGAAGGMSITHPLGVEPGAGRDLLTLMLYGSRLSFTVAFITSVASIGLGG
jgi:peptide/nickel transport system permease protein